jgi:hypothetical protein
VIAQHEGVRHGLERERGVGAGDQRLVGGGAESHDELIEGDLPRDAVGRGPDHPALDVHRLHGRLDEPGPAQRGSDRLRAVPELQGARACLEQQRREHEEVVPADQRDLGLRPAQRALELTHERDAREAAAEDHDA